jgi:hypothetical protein
MDIVEEPWNTTNSSSTVSFPSLTIYWSICFLSTTIILAIVALLVGLYSRVLSTCFCALLVYYFLTYFPKTRIDPGCTNEPSTKWSSEVVHSFHVAPAAKAALRNGAVSIPYGNRALWSMTTNP